MAQLRATAKELLERTRRLAGNCEPPRLARLAILHFVHLARHLRGLPVESPFDPSLLDFRDLLDLAKEQDGISQLWQTLNEPLLRKAFAAAGKGTRKFSASEIPHVTQLFTPQFVVDDLLRHTLGRQWQAWHPDSTIEFLPAALANLNRIPEPNEHSPATSGLARDIRLLDPACGTMNFGLAAIDVFRAMYREELARAGEHGWPVKASVRAADDIDAAILRHNLFGIDIDAFTLDLARHAIELKMSRGTGIPLLPRDAPGPEEAAPVTARLPALHLDHGDALFDRRFDDQRFDIIVTNPPYLSARNVSPTVVRQWKQRYPSAAQDLYACFIERSLQLLKPGGRAGLLTMQSFMFTGSYEPLRRTIHDRAAIEQITHFGPGLFDVGNPGTLQTVAFVLREESSDALRAMQIIRAIRLVDSCDAKSSLNSSAVVELTQQEMAQSPRRGWIYWLSAREREIIATFPKLRDIAPPRQGLATTDNARFVRCWWEVEPFSHHPSCVATIGRWMPYVKSGRHRRWYEAPRHRVNWEDDGQEIKSAIVDKYPYLNGKWEWVAKNASYYGRGGITYSYLTSGQFSARQLSPGAIFDVAGSSLFPDDPLAVLAVLNSSVGRRLLAAINPTVNFQVGDLAELPLPATFSDGLRENVARLIDLHRQCDQTDETSVDFAAPWPWADAADRCATLHGAIEQLERAVNEEITDRYRLPLSIERPAASGFDKIEWARGWVSFALRQIMADREWAVVDAALAAEIRDGLARMTRDAGAGEIATTVGDIETFLREEFSRWHNGLHRQRPRWWIFGDRRKQVLIAHDRADRATLAAALRTCRMTLPAGWQRCVDDGIAVNLAPLRDRLTDRNLARKLQDISAAAGNGELVWSRT